MLEKLELLRQIVLSIMICMVLYVVYIVIVSSGHGDTLNAILNVLMMFPLLPA